MKFRLIAAASCALLAIPAAIAAPHEGNAFIHDYDTNGDGQVTRAEFDAVRAIRFKATDANQDGWVSDSEYLSEYQARLEGQLAASDSSAEVQAEERVRQIRQTHVRFGVLDTNKDGKMQQAEYDASGARAFTQQDADKNTIVTAADVAATKARRAEMAAKTD
ncbi:hypothetical protein [Sphingobium boeckii]|uniref:EF-hand domain-containing protein n=1 Tax=Sphingobium boeckii TaxID=1082345 RepID=A0A7W9EDD3_9SPHN|nr:hypothetical protein [Sphingobium boeckii]MBB5685158.1 hypothetical protein [Sphingobium boeckii]